MKTFLLIFAGLVLFAQEPKPKLPTIEELQTQVTQLKQQVADYQKQLIVAQANINASQDMIAGCYEKLVEAHAKIAQKK
jgi:uncharacterized membrane-anchored protein YhcB (DUF1043 family)